MIGCRQSLLWSVIYFLVVSGGDWFMVEGCHKTSKELHICLNIYIERDLPFVETIIKGQKKIGRFGGGRILLDDLDVQVICDHATELYDCYKTPMLECYSYWQLYDFLKMMSLFQKLHSYLCEKTTNNARDLLLSMKCLMIAESHIANCSNHGFSWSYTWKEVLRMQVSPAEKCPAIDQYRTCLINGLNNVPCGEEAGHIYGSLLQTWYLHWCDDVEVGNLHYTSSGFRSEGLQVLVVVSMFSFYYLTHAFFYNN
ncbi:uncharacterized protein [Parasteatoda tepidariorum]|uniref:uncharacterized protein n=1 Tax=Parasteatoda tepidariorum TaxID=114398 RepID=UPI001C72418D|nr:uncharacterized protein LOC107456180 [Parasteatoda tepidariorum]